MLWRDFKNEIRKNHCGKTKIYFRSMGVHTQKIFKIIPICLHWLKVHRLPYSTDYKISLHLPRTDFPHKVSAHNRRHHDRMIETKAGFETLYAWQREHGPKKEFILHDGPPYANGDVHLGHAVNKILKDITVRNKVLSGYKVHFVPGWDCHGLPIELKALKGNQKSETTEHQLAIRKKAYEFSQKAKKKQLMSFLEWGILADWKNPYITCHPDYIVQQLKMFQNFYDQGIIFQDYKPVYWSPFNSPSIYVKFLIGKCPDAIKPKLGTENLNLMIWTTTPWTLPANQAVCYSADKKYSIVFYKDRNEFYLVASDLIENLSASLKMDLSILQTFEGSLLQDITYYHPLCKTRECPVIPGDHVTMMKGTGLVHCAPNHGFEDYTAVKKINMPLDICLVDENGCFTCDAGEILKGKFVLESGSQTIIESLKQDIILKEDFTHSYPYDWRSKTPVIIRSSNQWFVDVQQIKEQAKICLEKVDIYPHHLKERFFNQLESSPQWCISRQRAWGVPIPAFYDEKNGTIVNRSLTENLCNLIIKHGIHCWWELDIDQLLPKQLKEQCNLSESTYKKSSDIIDIWFDSGISWKNVLPEPHMSDICIEGIDQIRGWFNSSLLTSVAFQRQPPYKKLFLHGFTTDAEGRKMSKSEGNVISPSDILCGLQKYNLPALGIDSLRWWVAFHACQYENVAVRPSILEECLQNINKIRNTFKFLLGNLSEFDSSKDLIEPEKMRPLDQYMLHQLVNFDKRISEDYDQMQFKNVTKNILNFVTNDVSSFYCQLTKDRLYCDSKESEERLSCQTVLYFILNSLIRSLAAVCPHLAEEVALHHPNKNIGMLLYF
ncbi:isoleucine--tRNA ligase, mitochondrial-like [Uloborus diversus]|uniref:isoleucine--tRNA ligase, mitochondrial-like n=1 Tax=Uloborus diversus TaxID=327109 RepID=UPI002409DC0A|nr:isoleucine--tRNA ligase, mitochondrial-like [Uloborus diversus]